MATPAKRARELPEKKDNRNVIINEFELIIKYVEKDIKDVLSLFEKTSAPVNKIVQQREAIITEIKELTNLIWTILIKNFQLSMKI